jgi:hypothetical protein
MNRREKAVYQEYLDQGYGVLRNGAPDFVILKTEGGEIQEVIAGVEVKSPGGRMSHEQLVWKKIFEKAGIPFLVRVVP